MNDRNFFLFWSPDAIEPMSTVKSMKEQCRRIAAACRQQGLLFEADVFTEAAEKFEEHERQMEQATREQTS